MSRFFGLEINELRCSHCIGRNRKFYYMKCVPLKTMPSGKLKVLVFGDRDWGGEDQKVRYVEAHRVTERANKK